MFEINVRWFIDGLVLRTECIIFGGKNVTKWVAPSGGVGLVLWQRHLRELVGIRD